MHPQQPQPHLTTHYQPNQQQQQQQQQQQPQPQQQQQQQQQQQLHLPFPALHLHPVNDTFIPKQIVLNPNGAKVKIGRQTNQKSVPNSTNGFFDSKVLSRMHAEVWTENGKVLIRDVKSSNGTFINGERLSAEGVESEAFELHSDDLVEFGIDIIADDNKSIVHHKVATKVFLVLNAEDAAAATSFYRSNGPDLALNRRGSRPGVFGGGGFDHVLNRLQSELEKSRATGQELNSLNSTMNEIHDTLGGGNGPPPPLPPPYGGRIPPLVQQSQRQPQNLLQSQLAETRASLAMYADKMKSLESILTEHEQIKRELTELREHIEPHRSEAFPSRPPDPENRDIGGRVSPVAAMLELQEEEHQDRESQRQQEVDMDDDCASTSSNETATWKTSPNHNFYYQQQPNGASSPPPPPPVVDLKQLDSIMEQNHALNERIEYISTSLEDTVQLGQTLIEQHKKSSEIITGLGQEIKDLKEKLPQHQQISESVGSLETMIVEKVEKQYSMWTERLESGWKEQQARWEEERTGLQKIIQELEAKLEKQDRPQASTSEVADDVKHPNEDVKPPASLSKSSKRNRKKKSSQSSILAPDAAPSSPSMTTKGGEPNALTQDAKKPDQPSSLSSIFAEPPSESRSTPAPKLHSTSPQTPSPPNPSCQSSSATNHAPFRNRKVRSLIDMVDLKYISAAGGVALLGIVTYAFVNHFK